MTYPVDRIAIQQFRGLKNLTLEGLGRINLLVGENDAGKTSVLEAIAVYCQPLDLLRWLDLAERRDGQGQGQLNRVRKLRWLFPKSKTSTEHGPIQISGHGPGGDAEYAAQVVAIEDMRPDPMRASWTVLLRAFGKSSDAATETPRSLQAGIRIYQSLRLGGSAPQLTHTEVWPGEPLTQVVKPLSGPLVKLLSPFSHRLESLQLDLLSDATRADLRDQVLQAVRLMNPEVQALEILTVDGIAQLHIRHSERGLLPISLFGDGVRRTLTYALALAEVRGGVLLIDELETAIHASVLGPIFAWLVMACRRFNVQLFATTHSLEAVDAVLGACEKEQLSEVVAYRLSPERVKRFSGELLHGMRTDMGLDIRGGR